ncbi:MAG TPA: 2OG-Fe(II) oxygenase [Casimicrobiaceae bacterium]
MLIADVDAGTLTGVVEMIAAQGYAISPGFIDLTTVAALRATAVRFDEAGLLRPAAVGRGRARIERNDIRGDHIRWLDDDADDAGERALRTTLEALRVVANRKLNLGLLELEAHYAIYPVGTHYARHVDRFRGDDARVLSIVLYLNDWWRTEDGGMLRLYLSANRSIDVLPQGGTLVAFLSDRFAHEVLLTARRRMSIAGWFRRRT